MEGACALVLTLTAFVSYLNGEMHTKEGFGWTGACRSRGRPFGMPLWL